MPRISSSSQGLGGYDDAPGLELSDLRQQLRELKGTLEDAQTANGSVSVAKLRAEIEKTGDPALLAELDELLAPFQETVRTSYSAGCGGGRETRTTHEDPKRLSRDDVQRVLADLAAAQASAKVLDADGDGTLTAKELDAGGGSDSVAQRVLEASLENAASAEPEKPAKPARPTPTPSQPTTTYRAGCS